MKETINLAVIGLGGRGKGHINDCFAHMDDVNIVGVCDLYDDRAEEAADLVEKTKGKRPEIVTTDYKEI